MAPIKCRKAHSDPNILLNVIEHMNDENDYIFGIRTLWKVDICDRKDVKFHKSLIPSKM